MKIVCLSITICLLIATVCMSFGQNDPNTQMKATVQPGPVMRTGVPASADVFVGSRLAIRVAAPAGGMTPLQRAQIIANRLNSAFTEGFTWQDTRVSQVGRNWTMGIGGRMIATADTRSARLMGVSPARLASNWGSNTVVALGGMPSMIASQLTPVTTAVAGSREELAVSWASTPTKDVPVLNASTGENLGTVMIGGPSRSIGAVNSVVLYEVTQGNMVVRTYVPIPGTTTDKIARVPGVGIVGISVGMLPMSDLKMGSDTEAMVTKDASQWNGMINSTLSQNNVALRANSKVVPLYSTDQKQVIGAVQIVGSTQQITGTQRVDTTSSDTMLRFMAMGGPDNTTTMGQVVVSALIYMPTTGSPTTPTMVPPSTMPSTTTPTPGASGNAGEGTTPDTTETPSY